MGTRKIIPLTGAERLRDKILGICLRMRDRERSAKGINGDSKRDSATGVPSDNNKK